MMDDDLDLRDFSNVTRLFPLPTSSCSRTSSCPCISSSPATAQMTEDALAGDRLITMVQISPLPQGTDAGTSRSRSRRSAASGRIIQHERLPDGRFNFLLLGRKRSA